jgi:hypothetical protein
VLGAPGYGCGVHGVVCGFNGDYFRTDVLGAGRIDWDVGLLGLMDGV